MTAFVLQAVFKSDNLDRRLEFVSLMSFDVAPTFHVSKVDPWYEDDITMVDMYFNTPGWERQVIEFVALEAQNSPLFNYEIGFETDGDPGYVYIMEAIDSKPTRYKIGLSFHPEVRQRQLNRGQAPYRIEIVHTIPVSNMSKAENFLKTAFATERRHGEWFELTEWDLKVIKTLRFW